MTHEKAIIEILSSTQKLTTNKTQVISIFQSAGIIIDTNLLFVSFADDAESCVNSLMEKLSAMPVIKISAKRTLRSLGLATA